MKSMDEAKAIRDEWAAARMPVLVAEQKAKYPGHDERSWAFGASRRLMWEEVAKFRVEAVMR